MRLAWARLDAWQAAVQRWYQYDPLRLPRSLQIERRNFLRGPLMDRYHFIFTTRNLLLRAEAITPSVGTFSTLGVGEFWTNHITEPKGALLIGGMPSRPNHERRGGPGRVIIRTKMLKQHPKST